MRRRELDSMGEIKRLERFIEFCNGGNNVWSVIRFFEKDFVSDGDISDLIGWDVSEYVGLKPLEGGVDGSGGEGRQDLVGDGDHEFDAGVG